MRLPASLRARVITNQRPGDSVTERLRCISPTSRDVLIYVPVKLVSEANCRQDWRDVAARVKAQRTTTNASLLTFPGGIPAFPVSVQMHRVYGKRGKPFDSDNLVRSVKGLRDEIAAVYGIDDADPRISWLAPTQAQGEVDRVEVRIVSAAPRTGETK